MEDLVLLDQLGVATLKNENSYLDFVRFYGVSNIARNFQRFNLLYGFSYPHKFQFNCENSQQLPWDYNVNEDRFPDLDDSLNNFDSFTNEIKDIEENEYKFRNHKDNFSEYTFNNIPIDLSFNKEINNFRSTCLLENDYLFIGFPEYNMISNSQTIKNSGLVLIFYYNREKWIEVQRLCPVCNFENTYFGNSICFENDTLVISGDGDENISGAVYIFKMMNNKFIESQIILSPSNCKNFGKCVAISNKQIMISGNGNNSGLVYFYKKYMDDEWEEYAFNSEKNDSFGDKLIFKYPLCFISSPKEDKVYIYEYSLNGWEEKKTLTLLNDNLNGNFGNSMSFDNNQLVVSAPTLNNKGAVFIYSSEFEF